MTDTEVKLEDPGGPWKIQQRRCAEGCFVARNGVIIEYTEATEPQTPVRKLLAPRGGVTFYRPKTNKGHTIASEAVVCVLRDCGHEVVMKDMCATCGMNLREKDGRAGQRAVETTATVPMIHNVPELVVSKELAKQYGDKDREHCLAARKLVLLVDLDQTVIHTTNRQPRFDVATQADISRFQLYGGTHWTKLRPHTRHFFQQLSPLYEMHIVTFGQRQYAHKIAEIIDPEKRIFEHRILSRDESFSLQHKTRNLSALFPVGEEMVAIIDDRPDVWEFSDALIQLRPYKFFPDVDDINAPPGGRRQAMMSNGRGDVAGTSKQREEEEEAAKEYEKMEDEQEREDDGAKAAGGDENDGEGTEESEKLAKVCEKKVLQRKAAQMPPDDKDDALVHVERVLREVHAAFYRRYDETGDIPDLKVVISALRVQVLQGAVIVLSGVVPVGVRQERSDAFRICVHLGARVAERVDGHITHVIAARWGTTKVHEANKLGVPVVSPEWLYACLEQWKKVEERGYLVTAESANPAGAPLGSSVIPDLAKIPTMGKELLTEMNSEVDEALSEGDDDDEEGEGREEEEENDDEQEEDEEAERAGTSGASAPEAAAVSNELRRKSEEAHKAATLKRKLCPEARDRGWTGSSGGAMNGEDSDEDDSDDADDAYGSEHPQVKRSRVDEEQEAAENGEDEEDGDKEGADYGDESENGDKDDDDDDDEFDAMAEELEHQLEQ